VVSEAKDIRILWEKHDDSEYRQRVTSKFELTNQLLNDYLLFNDDTIFQLIILSHDKT